MITIVFWGNFYHTKIAKLSFPIHSTSYVFVGGDFC